MNQPITEEQRAELWRRNVSKEAHIKLGYIQGVEAAAEFVERCDFGAMAKRIRAGCKREPKP